MSGLPTGTVTFLFTDIEGSTRLWEAHPDAMRSALARHDRLLRSASEQNHGCIVKTTGDGIHAAFATAPQALRAAVDAQCALRAEPESGLMPLRVRMGLHTGSAELRDGDYYGSAVNRAAHLMAAGHGGQVLLSAVTQELVRDDLPDGASLRDLGAHHLKDLGRPEQIFQLLHSALPADFPPLRSLHNPALLNNLPQQPTSFIGREAQVTDVKALLAKTRLLTLTGAGGAGKTRLSLQAAAALLDGDGDGVWLVELAPLFDPALVPQAVADVLSVKEQAGQPILQALTDWLKTKRLLLILDNCEHLVAACASLASGLLHSCPGVHLLASSREPLNVPGEQIYRVPSLSLPDPERPQTAEALTEFEAVRLFSERAQAVRPGFAVTDANAAAVAQVCFRLDGIPLAIELAAARVRSLPVDEVSARLDNRFRLLTGGSRTALPRQQTLKALIDWSYDLLAENEKTLLQRLSVFAGGWTLEAAEAVCADSPDRDRVGRSGDVSDVLDLLAILVDKSLVVYEENERGQSRYRLLESVRQYGHDHLTEGGGADRVCKRHQEFFLRLAEAAEPELIGREETVWLARLEAEHDNLRSALGWCTREAGDMADAADAGLRLAGSLGRFWHRRGHQSEGRQWLGRMLELAGNAAAPAVQVRARNAAGSLALDQCDYEVVRTLYEQAVMLARNAKDKKNLAAALSGLGSLAVYQDDPVSVQIRHEECLALCRELGDRQGIAEAFSGLGSAAQLRGEYGAAQAFWEESLMLWRQAGSPSRIASCLNSLGNVALLHDDWAHAQALQEEALSLFRQIEDRKGICRALAALGYLTYYLRDYAKAWNYAEESLTLSRQMGMQYQITVNLVALGRIAAHRRDDDTARKLLTESITLARQLVHQRAGVGGLVGFVILACGHAQFERAARLLGAATALSAPVFAHTTPAAHSERDQQIDAVRAALSEEAFAAAFAFGQVMTLDAAIEYALSAADDAAADDAAGGED